MFSDIKNIGSASDPLKAEAVDSRLDNQRNSQDENSGNKHKKSVSSDVPDEVVSNSQDNFEGRIDAENMVSVNRFSLDSLIFFLEDYLEECITGKITERDNDLSEENSQNISTLAPWLRSKPGNSNVSVRSSSLFQGKPNEPRNMVAPRYAAHAYAHRAMLNNVSQPTRRRVKQHVVTNVFSSADQNEKTDKKIRDIYNLIRDLRDLKERGVMHLDVKDDAALLEGIGSAMCKDGI